MAVKWHVWVYKKNQTATSRSLLHADTSSATQSCKPGACLQWVDQELEGQVGSLSSALPASLWLHFLEHPLPTAAHFLPSDTCHLLLFLCFRACQKKCVKQGDGVVSVPSFPRTEELNAETDLSITKPQSFYLQNGGYGKTGQDTLARTS